MRMVGLSLCRSQASVALEKGEACLQLPNHELLQHSAHQSLQPRCPTSNALPLLRWLVC